MNSDPDAIFWELTHETKTSLCLDVMSGGFMSASKILPTQNMFPSSCKYEKRLRADFVCVKGNGSPDGWSYFLHVWIGDLGLNKRRGLFLNFFFVSPELFHLNKPVNANIGWLIMFAA